MNYHNYITTIISYLRRPAKRRLLRISWQLKSKVGLEVGGPSSFFQLRGYFPVYFLAHRIDGVNFSSKTVWEGSLQQGQTYKYYRNKVGFQYIAEATDLSQIKDNTYDFVLSCHSLEHIANPILALKEWRRVLKPSGMLVLVLPDKRFTFDNKRPYVTLEHLINDYEQNTDEHDQTHFEEILKYHDLSKDKGTASEDAFSKRLRDNYANRCAHHHVFNLGVVRGILEYSGFKVRYQQEVASFHLVTVAVK